MGWLSLGRITVATAGTVVRATNNLPKTSATSSYNTDGLPRFEYAPAEAIMFQAADTNVGKSYIGLTGFTSASTAAKGKLATLGIPTNNTIPAVTISLPGTPGAINAAEYFIDVGSNGDAVDVSILVN